MGVLKRNSSPGQSGARNRRGTTLSLETQKLVPYKELLYNMILRKSIFKILLLKILVVLLKFISILIPKVNSRCQNEGSFI